MIKFLLACCVLISLSAKLLAQDPLAGTSPLDDFTQRHLYNRMPDLQIGSALGTLDSAWRRQIGGSAAGQRDPFVRYLYRTGGNGPSNYEIITRFDTNYTQEAIYQIPAISVENGTDTIK